MGTDKPTSCRPSVEQAAPTERPAIAAINAAIQDILETTWQDYGHAARGVHAKSYGLLQGECKCFPTCPRRWRRARSRGRGPI